MSLFNPSRLPDFMGLPIRQSDVCLRETTERLFPVSKNRSRRIHKKLVKRHGGEFRKVPAIFKTPAGLICHPSLYAEVVRELKAVSAAP